MSPKILIAVPVKNAVANLATHFALLDRLHYPRAQITLAYLESDSRDGTFDALRARLAQMGRRYRRCRLLKQDMGFHVPPGVSRWTHEIQLVRRARWPVRATICCLVRSPTRTGCSGSMSM